MHRRATPPRSLPIAAVLVWTVVALAASPARADDAVDEAWRLYLSADFEGALAAFDQAEQSAATRNDVLRILEGRAQIYFAIGEAQSVRGALSRLASLSPDYRLSPETPPDLVDAFAAICEETPALSLDVRAERGTEGGVRIEAGVTGDVGGLVRELRITGRSTSGVFEQATDEPLFIAADLDEDIEYYVEAIARGGAVLASEGSAERPRRLTADASGLAVTGDERAPSRFLGLPVLAWVGIGAGVVVAAVVVAIVLATSASGSVQPQAPELP